MREEGGTPQIIGSIRAGLAMHLKEAVGSDLIEAIELACAKKVQKEWEGMAEVYYNSVCMVIRAVLEIYTVCTVVCYWSSRCPKASSFLVHYTTQRKRSFLTPQLCQHSPQ